MTSVRNTSRYPTISIALHWLMFLLIATTYALIELRVVYEHGSDPRETMKSLHYMSGLTVLLLVALRIWARLAHPAPLPVTDGQRAQRMAAVSVHYLLYAFMIGMPLLGWLMLSTGGDPVPFYGLELPALAAPDADLSKLVKKIHATVGEIGYYVIGAHALAALVHHYLLRDNTLRRMLPRRKS